MLSQIDIKGQRIMLTLWIGHKQGATDHVVLWVPKSQIETNAVKPAGPRIMLSPLWLSYKSGSADHAVSPPVKRSETHMWFALVKLHKSSYKGEVAFLVPQNSHAMQ